MFLYACTEQSVRDKHWDEFVKQYHTAFTNTLQKLGSNPNLLTESMLHAEIKTNAIFGAGMAMEAVTMSLLEDEEAADLDKIQVRLYSLHTLD